MASEAETPTGEDVRTRPMASLDSREPASTPEAGPTSPDERLRSLLEREEVEAVRGRLRRAVLVGLVGWGGFLLADFVTVFAFRDAPPLPFFSVRLGLIVVGVSVLLALDRYSAWTPRYLRIAEISVFVSAGLGVGALAALDRHGLASVHLKGTVLILLAHAVMLGSAWQRALVPVVLTALAPLGSMGIATMLSPTLEAQWRSPDLQDELLRTYSLLLGGTVLTLLGGHLVWGLRQQVAEARSIGRYRLRKRLAAGGMGEVWAAYHAALKRDVALKLVRPALGRDARAVARFEREVRATAELTHPGIVRVFDYGVTADGIWYYAMELLEGHTLESLVLEHGALAPERALRLVTQAAQALAEVHARGMVHRDVKPANLFVIESASEEYVKLIDFGIAKLGQEEPGLTGTGVVVGTPGYVAPEVLVGAQASARADVYALGMVLYFALAGRQAFQGDTPEVVVRRALEAEAPELPTELPADLARVLTTACAREPLERYADAEQMAHALRDCTLD